VRRVRPYIPLEVRVQVAERQLLNEVGSGKTISVARWIAYQATKSSYSSKRNLGVLLSLLAAALGDVLQLDHDPALILRQYKVDRRKPPAAWYTPNANDPDYLVYRPIRDHLEKTIGRKSDAEKTVTTKGSAQWLKAKFTRLEGRTKRRPKAKIPARKKPWPKRSFPKQRPADR